MSKNTPGPWRMAVDDEGVGQRVPPSFHTICCVESPTYDAIDIFAKRVSWDGDPMHDARLIAAAPDLLAACERLLRANEADYEHLPDMDVRTAFETNSMAINQARAAIAKAKGAPQ